MSIHKIHYKLLKMFPSVLVKSCLGFCHMSAKITFKFHFLNVFLRMSENSALKFVFESTEAAEAVSFLL